MNYYEEFGLPMDAPEAKIRHAYKTLARLLHPDTQHEEAVKAMAEHQMMRLNGMLDTLLDPAKRRAYDQGLFHADHPPMLLPEVGPGNSARMMQIAVRQWFWILTGLVIAALAVWYVAAKGAVVVEVVPAPPVVAVQETPPSERRPMRTAPGRAPGRSVVQARGDSEPGTKVTEAQPRTDDLPGVQDPTPLRTIERPTLDLAGPEIALEIPGADAGGTTDAERQTSWAGSWLYLPQPEDALDASLYVPSYIEFLITEENGNLAGNYRAKYTVSNKALVSEVGFQANGKMPSGTSAKLVWFSEDGAKGEMDLTLRSSTLLKVTWWTTASGRRPGLTSGTATLVRQRVR